MIRKRDLICSAFALAFAAQLGVTPVCQAGDSTPQLVVRAQLRHKPVDTPPSLDIYTALPKYEQMALSADGSEIAFITMFDNAHFLVTYSFTDKKKRFIKLTPGNISAISFADDDHVLLTTARTGLRGTCVAGAAANGEKGTDSSRDLVAVTAAPSAPGDPASAAEAAAGMSIMASLHSPDCVWYGVRAQDAVASVDVPANAGVMLGDRLSEYNNLPLGTPEPMTIGGKPLLVGPYYEMRAQTVNGQPAQRVYLWGADAQTGVGKMIDDGGGDIDRVDRYVDDWILDKQGVIVARAVYDYTSTVFSIEMKTGGKWKTALSRKIDPKQHTLAPFLIGLGADGQSVVILDKATDNSGLSHYYALSPDGTVSGPLEPDDAARNRPIFAPDTGRLAGFMQPGESDVYTLTDPDLQALYRKVPDIVPGENAHVVATATDPRKMIVYAQGGEDPGAYYFIDFTTGKSAVIGEDYADIPTDWVASQEQISYAAADGTTIHALLTVPPRPVTKNLPLVVLPHDGPQSHDALSFDWLAQALASRGYLVLQPNYRGSDGYGAAFMAAGYGEWGGKMQSDLSDGVRSLVTQGLADPKRVCVVGIGYGGYAALMAAGDPNTYRCAASINGISDIDGYAAWQKAQMALPEQDEMTSLIADPQIPRAFDANPGSPQILARYLGAGAASPAKQAQNLFAPVLLVHEDNDPIVPAQQSQTMLEALQSYKKPVEFVAIKGNDHALTTRESRLAAVTAVVDFLGKNNPAN